MPLDGVAEVTSPVARALLECAKVMERDGKVMGRVGHDDGPKCMVGTVAHVVNGTCNDWSGMGSGGMFEMTLRALTRAIGGESEGQICHFNNTRTRAESVAAFRQAAAIAEAGAV